MRFRTLLALLLALTAAAAADRITIDPTMGSKPEGPGGDYDGPRIPGDSLSSAVPIYVPAFAYGNTCNYSDDYDEICPFTGSTSPDLVFSHAPTVDIAVDIDLCASTYDTKVYVYENDEFTIVACNDDACAYQSLLMNVALTADNTYYIVIDGYGGDCGDFVLEIIESEPCFVECPPGAMPEGETTCHDNYDDQYNGGCGVVPWPAFQQIDPSCDPIVICGETGVFPFDSTTYRDTDWFEINLPEDTEICVSGQYGCPAQTLILDGRYACNGILVPAYYVSTPCETFSGLCWDCGAGTWWIWAGPEDWGPYPCGTVYWLEITGYTGGATPAESSTWGDVKALFR